MRFTRQLGLTAILAASIALAGPAFAQSPVVDYDLADAGSAGSGSPMVDYDLGGASPGNSGTSAGGSGGPVVDYDLGGPVPLSAPAAKSSPAPAAAKTAAQVAIPRNGPVLRPGRTHPDIALLRKRLGVPKPNGRSVSYYDDALEDAIKAFQREKGLDADGVVGRLTRAAF